MSIGFTGKQTFLLGIFLFLFFLAFHLPIYNYTAAFGDLGEYLNNPLRVLNGEMPYRDFWLLFPPGEVYLPALLYKLFGLNVNVVLISLAVINSLIGVAAFVLGKTIFKSNWLAILTALLVGFNGVMSVYVLFLLVAAIFFVKYLELKKLKEIILTGIFIGFAFYFRLFEVGAASMAFGLVFIAEAISNKMAFRKFLKFFGAFVGSVLLTVLIIYLPLWSIWSVMFKEIIFETLKHGTSMNLPYFYEAGVYLNLFKSELRSWLMDAGSGSLPVVIYQLGNLLRVSVLYLLPFLMALASFGVIFSKKIRHFEKVLIGFFILWGVAVFLKAMGRSDIAHLVHSLTPFVVLLVILFRVYKNLFIKIGLAFLIIILFLPMPLKSWNIKHTLAREHHSVSTESGALLFDNKMEAEAVNNLIKFVLENSGPEDFIFVTSWYTPAIYALTERKNPTYYDSLIDIVARPSKEKQQLICKQLLEKKTKLIIHNADWGFDGREDLQFKKNARILDECIRKNFDFKEKFGSYEVYVWPL